MKKLFVTDDNDPELSYPIKAVKPATMHARLEGPDIDFVIRLTPDILESMGCSLTTEDGNHAELTGLQAELQAGIRDSEEARGGWYRF